MAPHSQRAALALDEAVPNECQTKCFAAGAQPVFVLARGSKKF